MRAMYSSSRLLSYQQSFYIGRRVLCCALPAGGSPAEGAYYWIQIIQQRLPGRLLKLLQMITRTLFQASAKDLQPKPHPAKVKHKTYRELLGLDRPRKKIRVQSDDDNDDFLERLLKQQAKEKEKKKKSSIRRSYSPSSKHSRRNNKEKPQSQNNGNQNTNKEGLSSRENESQYASRQLKSIQLKNQSKLLQDTGLSNKSNISREKKAHRNQPPVADVIKIDSTDAMPIAVTSKKQLPIKVRSQKALTILKETQHKSTRPEVNINHAINPETQQIVHRFSLGRVYEQFKHKPISYEKMVQMSEPRVTFQPKTLRLRQSKLFKDQAQQDLLLRTIQSLGRRKTSKIT